MRRPDRRRRRVPRPLRSAARGVRVRRLGSSAGARRAARRPSSDRRPGSPPGSACRPSPRSGRGTAPARGPTPVVLSVSPSRWNGSEDPFQVGRRDARATVDDPQLDPVAEAAAGEDRWRLGRGVPQGVGHQVGDAPAPAAPGRPGRRAGRPVRRPRPGARPARGRPGPAATTSSSATGRHSTDMAPACSRLMSSRLLDEMGESVQRLVGGQQQLGPVLRGPVDVTAAQARHRRLGRRERSPQVVADGGQQARFASGRWPLAVPRWPPPRRAGTVPG